nr:translation initiation factor IF-2-like [Equus asinus]
MRLLRFSSLPSAGGPAWRARGRRAGPGEGSREGGGEVAARARAPSAGPAPEARTRRFRSGVSPPALPPRALGCAQNPPGNGGPALEKPSRSGTASSGATRRIVGLPLRLLGPLALQLLLDLLRRPPSTLNMHVPPFNRTGQEYGPISQRVTQWKQRNERTPARLAQAGQGSRRSPRNRNRGPPRPYQYPSTTRLGA